MTASGTSILEQALQLAEEDRSEIAYRLLETFSAPDVLSLDGGDFQEELDRRAADHLGSRPWSEVRDLES